MRTPCSGPVLYGEVSKSYPFTLPTADIPLAPCFYNFSVRPTSRPSFCMSPFSLTIPFHTPLWHREMGLCEPQ